MTVVRLEVDSYKRLRAAHVTPTPTGLILVRGKNAAGKSSLIESMLDVLGVEKADLPITEGVHAGGVKVRLSNGNSEEDLIVEEKITRDSAGKAKRALSITAANGSKKKGPAGVLKSLRGHFADPVAFLDMPDAEQVKTVLKTLGLDEELAILEDAHAGLYDRRRDLGRDVDRLGKALAEISTEVEGLPEPSTTDTIEGLTTDLQTAKDHNATIGTHQAAMRAAEARGKEAAARLERLQVEVAKLEEEIAVQRNAWDLSAGTIRGESPIDPAPIVEALKAHEEAAKHAGRRELLESTRAQHEEAVGAHGHIEEGLVNVRQSIAELLGSADFPVDVMAYDHEAKTLMIGGIPFSQASQAERLKAAAAIAMAGSPTIRVMFAREGSLLDEESRVQLAEIAEASGFQLWLEVVESKPDACARPGCGLPLSVHGHGETGRDDSHPFEEPAFIPGGVWIEDGEAFQ